MNGPVTIKMLAKELKLSVATISKALRDSYDISAETKKRVQDHARKLNYTPNPYASSLRKRKSKTIAVVLPEVTDSFFSLAINGIESVAQLKGYHVLIYLTHESFEKESTILKDFQSGRVDGVLLSISAETENHAHIRELQERGVPIVFFDRVSNEINTAKITTNDLESGYLAANHLVNNGCKRIAFLSVSRSLSISNKRMEGYKKALSDNNFAFKESDIIYCSNDSVGNRVIIKKILLQKRHPDGMIASVEKLATDIYLACKELNLSIPGDVKVIGFSNLSTASILAPSLTTITQPAFDMGKAAATILFKVLDKPTLHLEKESLVIASKLDVRESTGV